MCCLKYEQDVYEEKLAKLPKVGAIVKTEDGEGIVEGVETLKELLKVKIEEQDNIKIKKYPAKDVVVIKDVEVEEEDNIDENDLRELEKMEELDKEDMQN